MFQVNGKNGDKQNKVNDENGDKQNSGNKLGEMTQTYAVVLYAP